MTCFLYFLTFLSFYVSVLLYLSLSSGSQIQNQIKYLFPLARSSIPRVLDTFYKLSQVRLIVIFHIA